jgi:hypothetical protein
MEREMSEENNVVEAQDPSRFQIPAALRQAAAAVVAEPMVEPVVETLPEPVVDQSIEDAFSEVPKIEEVSFESPEEEPVVEEKKHETKVILKGNPNIDLTNLQINTTSAMGRSGIIEKILNNKSTFMIVCPQSAYVAKISSLCLEDKIRILNSVESPFESRRKLYRSIYDHIIEMNIPKPKFDEWLKMTSYHDLETLLYGLYAQTYPGESDFDITCGKCENKIDAKIGAHLLQQIKDETAFGYLDSISKSSNPEDVASNSMVHTTSRVLLPTSNIVVDICTPSLSDHLILLKAFNPKFIADISNIIGMMLFIKQLFIPDSEKLENEGRAIFFPVTDRNEMLRIVSRLSPTDGDRLNEEINERAKKFEVNYQLPKMVCAACANEIEAINIDCENLLFSKLMEKA